MKTKSKFLSIIIIFLIVYSSISYLYFQNAKEKLFHQKYLEISNEMTSTLKTLIDEKKEAVLLIALSLSLNEEMKVALNSKSNSHKVNLQDYLSLLTENSSMKSVWLQVLTDEGISKYRSWTDKKGDSVVSARIDVAKMIQDPKTISSISTGKFDMTFKSMVPIYKDDKFIGSVEAIARFNSVVKKMQEKGTQTLVIVDKAYTTQLTKATTNKFIHNYYIATIDPDNDLLELFSKKSYKNLLIDNTYIVDKERSLLVTTYVLDDLTGNKMGYFLLSKQLKQIDMLLIEKTLQHLIITLLSIAFFLIGYIYYSYVIKYNISIKKQNALLEENVKEKTKELYYTAHHDSLTKLPNRILFLDRLDQMIKYSFRHKKNAYVLFLDLDGFKNINDTYGHQMGDKLLIDVALRLKTCIREVDTIARIGGDEFTIIVQDINSENMTTLAHKIKDVMKDPFVIEEIEIYSTFSIGIANYPDDGELKDELLKHADIAMYRAKDAGRNTFKFFN